MLDFPSPLIQGKLIKRYKRFLADVELKDGEVIQAHCPNTGSMATCAEPGAGVLLSISPNKARKLPHTWELTKTKGGYIGINTARPNQIVAQAVEDGLVEALSGYETVKKEAKYCDGTRFDLKLTGGKRKECFVEIKNVTLYDADSDAVRFPDAKTERGLKHLHHLIEAKKEGYRSVMLFLVNRPEGEYFAPAAAIDPAYAEGLKKAKKAGVELIALRAKHTLKTSTIAGTVPIRLNG